jgi:hypothetical protein
LQAAALWPHKTTAAKFLNKTFTAERVGLNIDINPISYEYYVRLTVTGIVGTMARPPKFITQEGWLQYPTRSNNKSHRAASFLFLIIYAA